MVSASCLPCGKLDGRVAIWTTTWQPRQRAYEDRTASVGHVADGGGAGGARAGGRAGGKARSTSSAQRTLRCNRRMQMSFSMVCLFQLG